MDMEKYGKSFRSFVYVIIDCVSAGISTLMSISDGSDPYFFRQKMQMTRPMKGEMDGEVFIFHQSFFFSVVNSMVKVLFPVCTLTWRVNNYVSRQGKVMNWRNESTIVININDFGTGEAIFVTFYFFTVADSATTSLEKKRVKLSLQTSIHSKNKEFIQFSQLLSFFPLPKLWQH